MDKKIYPTLHSGGTETARTTLATELTAFTAGCNRSYIQDATAVAGHKITTVKLRKILTGETDPTLMDILAIAEAVEANPIPLVIRAVKSVTK